jgi:arylsulfatase A-like enzyme
MLLGFQKGSDRHSETIQDKVERMTESQLRLWRNTGEVPITSEIDPWFESEFFLPDTQAMISNYVLRVEKTDREMHRLLDTLKQSGHLDHTVLCITSDHGETFFERDRVYGHGGNRRDYIDPYLVADSSFHTELIYTPLIFQGADRISSIPEYIESSLTSSVDIMPSLLDIAGLIIPQGLAGISVLSDVAPNRFTIVENQRTMRRALITSDWKLITGLNPVELYDRRRDPAETKNISHLAVETRRELETLFQEWSRNRFLRFEPDNAKTDPELRRHLQLLGYLHDPDSNDLP